MANIKETLEEKLRQDVITSLMRHKRNLDLETLVKKLFDQGVEQVILKLMGFEKDWDGRWKVDNCNGRSGNSVIGDDITNKARAELAKFISEKLDIVDLWSQLSNKEIDDLKKEYKETYLRQMRERMRDWGARNADSRFEEIFGEAITNIFEKEISPLQVDMEKAITKKQK